jgi:hypothetical protein
MIGKNRGDNRIRFFGEPDTVAPFLYIDGGEGENKDTQFMGIFHPIKQHDQRC